MATPDAPAQRPGVADRALLFGVLTGGWLAQCCYALAKLGVPDLLAGGPRTAADLAAGTGTDARALYRMLRVLAAAGLLRQDAGQTFALTPATRLLCADTPRSSRLAAVIFGEEVHRCFGEILYTLRTGRPAFDAVYGKPFYDYLGEHPQAAATFSAAMGAAAVPAALATCDLSDLGTLVDVGGGDGGLLAKVLARHPAARGVLLDLPDAVAQARARFAAAGLGERVELVEGSFFDAVPAGADVYVLARVLHNWDDEQAAAILRRVRAAVPEHGRLLVFEHCVDQPAEPADLPPGATATPLDAQPQLIDLLMLLMLPGQDRTEAEYRALLSAAGFRTREVRAARVRASRVESVIEAVPARVHPE